MEKYIFGETTNSEEKYCKLLSQEIDHIKNEVCKFNLKHANKTIDYVYMNIVVTLDLYAHS